MNTLLSLIIAITLVAGVAASANALDAKSFYEQQDRQAH
jgi:hypothetical protein